MRVRVYIDGFNLYYRALRKSPHKWLDVSALARGFLDDADTIDRVNYYTARVSPRSGDPEAPRRQQLYLSALGTLPDVKIHYGRFLPKEKWRPVAHPHWDPHVVVQVKDTEEKGSDVNLASHMLYDALKNQYDAALLLSQDTDLCEPMRMVRDEGKLVGLVCLDGRKPNKRLSCLASFVRHVTPARLAAAQLPVTLMGKNGHPIAKPEAWTTPTIPA